MFKKWRSVHDHVPIYKRQPADSRFAEIRIRSRKGKGQPPFPSTSRRPMHRRPSTSRRNHWPRSSCSNSKRLRNYEGRTSKEASMKGAHGASKRLYLKSRSLQGCGSCPITLCFLEFGRQAAGSHEIWYNEQTGRYTTLPNQPGDIPESTNPQHCPPRTAHHNEGHSLKWP